MSHRFKLETYEQNLNMIENKIKLNSAQRSETCHKNKFCIAEEQEGQVFIY